MSDSTVSPPGPAAPSRFRTAVVGTCVRTSLLVSPRPTARILRSVFERAARDRSLRLLAAAPADVDAVLDERYGDGPDALLDLYLPGDGARDGTALPVVVWTHGGAFVGGSKDELAGYFRTLAARGFAVAGLRYTLAPKGTYPTPVRQVLAALGHLAGRADQLHLDPSRVVLAGDSAGAQISAQAAAVATDPAYAEEVGIASEVDPAHLRGVVLCCGIFDFVAVGDAGPFRDLFRAVGWAYSGTREFTHNRYFMSTVSVADHLSPAFPPTFLTVGNADPLRPQSEAMAAALSRLGVEVETAFPPPDHRPALGHEYQFEPDQADARAVFERLVGFVDRCTRTPS